ncbi:MAG: polysaccharide deacetylase family protein [Bacteroidia bacterium]|nr:polysaccharide deacetylase family protein [Bacteroidia bacterium]
MKLDMMIGALATIITTSVSAQTTPNYAEKLGWKKDDKVIIFHVDDAGMSYESNKGAIKAMEFGIATSVSVMMPCPWSAAMLKYLNEHPEFDAGLHLTHTSEWKDYRWGPVTGNSVSAGLVDHDGALWNNVNDVLKHATTNEIEAEIEAQIKKAKLIGFKPTHLDTHMGTLWASPQFLECYINAGVKEHIPVLYAGGHGTLLMEQLPSSPLSGLSRLAEGQSTDKKTQNEVLAAIQKKGHDIWKKGLAVVDDMYVSSYDWSLPENLKPTDKNLDNFKTKKYKALLESLKPGITVIMVHCSDTGTNEFFQNISNSGNTRKGDLLAMKNSGLKKYIQEQGIILTTWRELQERRDKCD